MRPNKSMIPKSCRLFGQDHATGQSMIRKVADFSDKIMRPDNSMIPKVADSSDKIMRPTTAANATWSEIAISI